MKLLLLFSRPSIFIAGLIILICFSLPSAQSATPGEKQSQPKNISAQAAFQQRAANADLELRQYKQRIATASAKMKSSNSFAIPPEVGITIRKDLQTASTIFYQDDMESGVAGWTLGGGGGLWHQTTRDANSPTHSWWDGIESQGNYYTGARVNNALISPAIDLTSATGPVTVLFTENYVTEAGWDFCMVDVSTDGGTVWSHLRGGYGESPSGDSYGWIVSTLNLTPYVHQTINLRFVFDTGDSLFNTFPGWFVDNVVIFDQSGTTAGMVYYDWNQNGIFDGRDRGIHWLVTATGPITITAQTGGSGFFNIPIPLGSYQISEELPSPWIQTSSPASWQVNLTSSGQIANGNNFGNYRWGCFVEGATFADTNKDSIYEPGEPPGDAEEIVLFDSAGTTFETSNIPASGPYSFLVFYPGSYTLKEYLWPNWVSTLPAGQQYKLTVAPTDTVLGGYLFGSYEVFGNGTIRGQVFNDVNRNGVRDSLEPGLAGWRVSSDDGASAWTDSLGNYVLNNVFAGVRLVNVHVPIEWAQSIHGALTVLLDTSETKDSVSFGVYVLQPGSISGTVFNDLNGDGIREPNEPVVPNSELYVSGNVADTTWYLTNTIAADDSGHYQFAGLWRGSYQVRVGLTSHWRQTFPPSMQAQHIDLGQEDQHTGIDFGLKYDSTFNIAYRSFIPESIAYVKDHTGKAGKSEKVKPAYSEATFDLMTPVGGLTGLKVLFSQTVDSSTLTVSYFQSRTHDAKLRTWEFKLTGSDTLAESMHVILYAHGNMGKPLTLKYSWERGSVVPAPGTKKNIGSSGAGHLDLPMPNEINVLESMYYDGTGSQYGITVGLVPGAHSVYFTTAATVWKSLFDPSHHHINVGQPRCLGIDAVTLKPFKKTMHGVIVKHVNNVLFAEALTLKVNLKVSELGITPYGLGGLIFEGDSSNVFNGLSVQKITAKLDSSLSAFDDITKTHKGGDTCLCDSNYFKMAYTTIRMIDSAFSGPMDTISFAGGLVLKPVRELSDVPFLRLDSSFSQVGTSVFSRIRNYIEEPRQVSLFQNYPNPFNPTTRISFVLPAPARVSLTVYNLLGQQIVTLLNKENMDEGEQTVEFNAASYASGVYFYRLVVEGKPDENGNTGANFTAIKKMVLLK